HRGDDQLDGLHEGPGVERAVVLQELHEVERREVAGAVVEAHVLRARVRRVDPPGLGVGVPVVDRGVVLDARVGALPGGLGDLAEQGLRVDRVDDRAVDAGPQPELRAVLHRAHELAARGHRVMAFLCWRVVMSFPPKSMSFPASRSARILFSSRALVSMNSSMSGWSMSRTTIFAARRVAPPDLMVPAEASAPRMKLTGPEAVPPEDSSSFEERMRERFRPAPEPPLKMSPSSRYQLRIESISSSTARMKH